MAETPHTQNRDPAPRPPRQPDPKLITYLEKGKGEVDESDELEPASES